MYCYKKKKEKQMCQSAKIMPKKNEISAKNC